MERGRSSLYGAPFCMPDYDDEWVRTKQGRKEQGKGKRKGLGPTRVRESSETPEAG